MITGSSVLQLEVLIRKLPPVDRFPPSSVVVGEISSLKTHKLHCLHATACQMTKERHKRGREVYLAHEVRDHPVENWSLVAEAMFSRAQRSEVLCKKDIMSDCLSGQWFNKLPRRTTRGPQQTKNTCMLAWLTYFHSNTINAQIQVVSCSFIGLIIHITETALTGLHVRPLVFILCLRALAPFVEREGFCRKLR